MRLSEEERKWLSSPNIIHKKIAAKAEEIFKFREELNQTLGKAGFKNAYLFILGFDELLTNVMEHGYRYDARRKIEVLVAYGNHRIILKIADKAPEFNPMKTKHPSTSELLSQGATGGYGSHLCQKIFTDWKHVPLKPGNLLQVRFSDALGPDA